MAASRICCNERPVTECHVSQPSVLRYAFVSAEKRHLGAWRNLVPARFALPSRAYRPAAFLPDVACPVLLIAATHDHLSPAHLVHAAANATASLGAAISVMEWNTSHFGAFRYGASSEGLAVLVRFLKQHLQEDVDAVSRSSEMGSAPGPTVGLLETVVAQAAKQADEADKKTVPAATDADSARSAKVEAVAVGQRQQQREEMEARTETLDGGEHSRGAEAKQEL